jgi:hypothetical protein
VYRAVGQIETSGVVSLTEVPDLEWKNLRADEEVIVQTVFYLKDFGEGEIKAQVLVLDELGKTRYGRAATLYFLVTKEGVFTGTSSPLLLKLEYLERLLKSGTITQKEYEEAREKVLGGGAIETNEPLP